MSSSEPRNIILNKIKIKRDSIKCFIANLEPFGSRLTNFNIICGAIATALMATPAIGGKPLMDAFSILDPNSLTWRILFAIAALFSLLSTIAASLYKSNEIASHLGKAQVCDAKLEGLEMLIKVDQITLKDAVSQYNQYITEITFIIGSRFVKLPSAIDLVKGEINEPKPNQDVENTISCSGRVEGMDSECHLWLAVEADGYIWPKEREIFAEDDGSWKVPVYEQGKTATFSLSLFVADSQANKRIRAWVDEGDATGNYIKMRRLPGTRRIDSINGLRRVNVS